MSEAIQIKQRDHFSVGVLTYIGTAGLVYVLMMLAGAFMRAAQGTMIDIDPEIFYQLMTVHGAGMVGISAIGGASIMWHFLSKYVALNNKILWLNYGLFLAGVVLILSSIFLTGFAGAWTFLYPLPAISGGVWEPNAAVLFLVGLALIGVGFLLLHLETARAIIRKYGSLGAGLGWPQLFGSSSEPMPPATVVATTMVIVANVIGLVSGATVILISLTNLISPEFEIDSLLAKNMIYFFGHVFINCTIYMAVIAVYEILPQYAGRPYKVNKVFLAAWTASTIMVMAVYPHHLLMDGVMPKWALIIGQIISYTNGLPVMVVTAFGALMLIYRSGIKWSPVPAFLVLSLFGWTLGVIPAIADATIAVNRVMHNTMWVPGHFHIYLIVGLLSMLVAFMFYITSNNGHKDGLFDKVSVWLYGASGIAFSFIFLLSGANSVPRRWAVHLPEWVALNKVGAILGVLVFLLMTILVIRFLVRIKPAALPTGTPAE